MLVRLLRRRGNRVDLKEGLANIGGITGWDLEEKEEELCLETIHCYIGNFWYIVVKLNIMVGLHYSTHCYTLSQYVILLTNPIVLLI